MRAPSTARSATCRANTPSSSVTPHTRSRTSGECVIERHQSHYVAQRSRPGPVTTEGRRATRDGLLAAGFGSSDESSRGSANPHDAFAAIGVYAPLLVHPASHLFVGFGPQASTDLVHDYHYDAELK